jgi:hypothetical protein
MRITVTSAFVAALVGGGSAMLAAPGQQTTLRPGQMTEARVWVQNRAPNEAVPISIQDAAMNLAPLRVRIVNAQGPAPAGDEPVRVMLSRQRWSYRTVVLQPGAQVGSGGPLEALGNDGWETTGITFGATDGGVAVLLKRPS